MGCDDDQQFGARLGFDDDFPGMSPVPSGDDPSTLNDIALVGCRPCEHGPQIDLVELAILHALEQVGTELELPIPPFWPVLVSQSSPHAAAKPVSGPAIVPHPYPSRRNQI